MISRISIFLLTLCLSTTAFSQKTAHVSFTIKNAGINVKGTFETIKITQLFNPDNLIESQFDVSILATTINTGIKGRDKHLRKAKYFDVENHPNITFKSNNISKSESGFLLKGNLKIKATTKSVEIPFTIEKPEEGAFLKGYLEIDRRDYGVGKNHLIMGDKVKIYIEIPYTD